jgi:hypothetical protein
LADFSTMLKRVAPDIESLGLSLEGSVAILEALADKGIQGSSATLELRTAISAADGDINIFYESLGLTAGEVAEYTAKVKDSEGMTQEYADAMNTQYGFMDKLKYGVSELTLKYGAMLQPVEALGPIMAGLGPILIVVSNIHWGRVIPAVLMHTKALGGMIAGLFASGGALSVQAIGLKLATAATWLMNTALYACPLVWIVGAIVAVVAVLVILEKKFGVVTSAVKLLTGAIHTIIGFFGGVVDAIRGVVVDTDKLTEANERLIDAEERVEGAIEELATAEQKAEESAEDLAEASAELAKAQLEVSEAAREVDVLTEAYEELKSAMDAAAGITEELSDLDRNLRSAQLDLLDAQDKLSEATGGGGKNSKEAKAALEKYKDIVKEHGADSEEAAKAQNKYSMAISKNTVTARERERAAIALERAQDRVDDITKKIIDTTEEETIVIAEAARVQKEQGYESVGSMKEILDAKVAVLEENSGEVEKWAAITEERREKHEWNLEDVERWKYVHDQEIKDMEEAAAAKERVLEGEVDATESAMGRIKAIVESHWADILNIITPGGLFTAGQKAIGGFIDGIRSKSGEVGAAVDKSFKEAESKMPHSDAKEGPFSDLSGSGKSVVETFAKGIESASGTVGNSFAAGITPGDTYGADTLSVGPNYLSRDYDFPTLMKDIEAYQSQKRVQRGIRTI